jgi:glycosyltransferase involved in cell wall biosynthesis
MRRGHGVEVACQDLPTASWLSSFPLPVHAVGPAWGTYGFSSRWLPWVQNNAAQYDVVVINGLWQYVGFGTWQGLRKRQVPYVIYPHGALDPWFKRRYPLKHAKKWMYWPWAEYRVLRDAQAVLFTSQAERFQSRSSFWLYRVNEVVVGAGTSEPPAESRSQMESFYGSQPKLRGKRLILYLGRLHPRKGCDLAIQAFARTLAADPSWQLVVAGPDQIGWKRQLLLLAERSGAAQQTTWIDSLAGDAKWGAIRAAEIFCLPSHGENFSLVVAEALACGTPVLISNRVQIWPEVQSGGAGLVAADTLAGTCALMRDWAGLDETGRRQMRVRARRCFETSFAIESAAGRLADTLAQACSVGLAGKKIPCQRPPEFLSTA